MLNESSHALQKLKISELQSMAYKVLQQDQIEEINLLKGNDKKKKLISLLKKILIKIDAN